MSGSILGCDPICQKPPQALRCVMYPTTFTALSTMKKNKKNKPGRKQTLLGGAVKSIKKLGKGTGSRIGALSTTQKVVGGAALVALGLSYLAKRQNGSAADISTDADAAIAEENLAAMG